MNIDPATGQPFPADAIQRILFIAPKVHVYNIPPLTSTQGYKAATWTADNNKRLIFTARLRVLEASIPLPNAAPTNSLDDDPPSKITTNILLEDPSNGQLFAAGPYTAPAVVSQAIDSSRFFALRVVGEGNMKATLGIGFEERSEAFDFNITLQECRKVLGWEGQAPMQAAAGGRPGRGGVAPVPAAEKRDFSLKEGETITVNIGGRGRRSPGKPTASSGDENAALFSIKPPPNSGGGAMPFLPPPPSASEVKAERRKSRGLPIQQVTAQDLGFDDGEFGEFQ